MVNVGLSLREGMADRRISYGNTKPTCHSRASPSQEQGADRRSEATTEAEACLGNPRPPEIGREPRWPGRFHERLHISTRQYARIVRDWVTSIGLEASVYRKHSMRRTKVTQIYKKTGNQRAAQLLLGHTKMDSTVRYRGVKPEAALAIAEPIEI
jgi:hypothetical protein